MKFLKPQTSIKANFVPLTTEAAGQFTSSTILAMLGLLLILAFLTLEAFSFVQLILGEMLNTLYFTPLITLLIVVVVHTRM